MSDEAPAKPAPVFNITCELDKDGCINVFFVAKNLSEVNQQQLGTYLANLFLYLRDDKFLEASLEKVLKFSESNVQFADLYKVTTTQLMVSGKREAALPVVQPIDLFRSMNE